MSNATHIHNPASSIMSRPHDALQWQIELGWISALLVMLAQFMYLIARSLLTEADHYFRSLHLDPGMPGLQVLIVGASLYALMPMAVVLLGSVGHRGARWLAVTFAAFAFGNNLLHHLSHVMFGDRPNIASNVPDLALHLIGIWVLVNSIRWARRGPRVLKGPLHASEEQVVHADAV